MVLHRQWARTHCGARARPGPYEGARLSRTRQSRLASLLVTTTCSTSCPCGKAGTTKPTMVADVVDGAAADADLAAAPDRRV